jgi:methylated-DNA-[protein]-cysteine S-methyltransferase
MFYYDILSTPAGWSGVLATDSGLVAITLPQKTEAQARRALGEKPSGAAPTQERFRDLAHSLETYFNGTRTDFTDALDLSGASPFERRVWETARLIPYGETRSYGWLASKLGQPGAARAVGQALGRNPLPIIVPCHRVVAGDGGLGGYSGGIEVKKWLLKLEGQR